MDFAETHSPRILVIADDLTGLIDALVPLAVSEPEAMIDGSGSWSRGAAVGGMNTNTRHASPDQAREAVRQGLQRADGSRVIFKKVDSTLRGNIGAELAALRDRFPSRPIFYVPAFPAAGRVVIGGTLQVDGVAVEESAFASDPLAPVQTGDIATLLKSHLPNIRLVPLTDLRAGAIPAGEPGEVIVFDGELEEDLDRVAEALFESASKPPLLLVGCGGLARRLPRWLGVEGAECAAMSPALPPGPTVVFSGSVTPRSLAQLQHACERGALAFPVPLVSQEFSGKLSLPQDWIEQSAAALAEGRNVLFATAFSESHRIPRHVPGAGQVAGAVDRLAALARELVSKLRPPSLTLFGGETACAVLKALGCHRVRVLGELFPGVGHLSADTGNRPLSIITKSGGFGPEYLLEALKL